MFDAQRRLIRRMLCIRSEDDKLQISSVDGQRITDRFASLRSTRTVPSRLMPAKRPASQRASARIMMSRVKVVIPFDLLYENIGAGCCSAVVICAPVPSGPAAAETLPVMRVHLSTGARASVRAGRTANGKVATLREGAHGVIRVEDNHELGDIWCGSVLYQHPEGCCSMPDSAPAPICKPHPTPGSGAVSEACVLQGDIPHLPLRCSLVRSSSRREGAQ